MELMSWGEFKKKVEEFGITDDWKIEWIDILTPDYGDFGKVYIVKDDDKKEFTVWTG